MTVQESIHGFVEGIVQGVGFRYHAMKKATALGLSGWVRNLPDGRVEFYAEGPSNQLEELLTWLRRGPENARVTSITVRSREPLSEASLHRFEIR